MKIEANSVQDYLSKLPEDKKKNFLLLREVILKNLKPGFEECLSYGMIGYVVPHSIYPDGYHCDSKLPLPFINIGVQKNFIGFYHLGLYADEKYLNWFVENYKKSCDEKLDMGKSCIRLKKNIPFQVFGNLVKKISVKQWIKLVENSIPKKRNAKKK